MTSPQPLSDAIDELIDDLVRAAEGDASAYDHGYRRNDAKQAKADLVVAIAADLTEARGRIAALEAQVHTMMDQDIDWINREAAICEEDVGFEETIHVLRKQLTAALADCRTLAKLASGGSIKDRFGSLEAHDDAVNRRDFYIREDQRLKEMPK